MSRYHGMVFVCDARDCTETLVVRSVDETFASISAIQVGGWGITTTPDAESRSHYCPAHLSYLPGSRRNAPALQENP